MKDTEITGITGMVIGNADDGFTSAFELKPQKLAQNKKLQYYMDLNAKDILVFKATYGKLKKGCQFEADINNGGDIYDVKGTIDKIAGNRIYFTTADLL